MLEDYNDVEFFDKKREKLNAISKAIHKDIFDESLTPSEAVERINTKINKYKQAIRQMELIKDSLMIYRLTSGPRETKP